MRFLLFTLIVFVLLFSSCTIQKRLYQPGWNISFSGSMKSNLKSPVESSFETNNIKSTDEKIVEEFPEKIIEQVDDNEADVNDITKIDKEQPIKSNVHLNQLQEILGGEISQNNKITFFKPKPKKNDSKSTRTASIIGLILISVGAFLFIIGLLIFLSSDTSIFFGLFSIFIGAIFMYIGGLIILITLLVLLIMFITRAIIKNEKRIKEQSQVVENEPSVQPNVELESQNNNEEIPTKEESTVPKKELSTSNALIIVSGIVAAFTLIYLFIKP